jgi:Methyltransferase domain
MGSITWGQEIAEIYDQTYAARFEPPVLGPIVDLLAELGRGGSALEFAVGTGRVALPLSGRGIAVHGIELSPHMAEQLLAKPGAEAVAVTIGDMTATREPGTFNLVYLVANTIMNVTTQDEQLRSSPTRPRTWSPAGASWWRCSCPSCAGCPPASSLGCSPSIQITSGSRPSTTCQARSRGRITGSRRAGAWCASRRPTGSVLRSGPDGQAHWFPVPGPLGGLGPGAIHLRQSQPGRGV